MIKIISDENKGVMVDASGQMYTIVGEIAQAIENLCDDIIKKHGMEAGLAFSEAIISTLEHTKGMRTEEILKSQALKPSEAPGAEKKYNQEELERAQMVTNLWNDIVGGRKNDEAF